MKGFVFDEAPVNYKPIVRGVVIHFSNVEGKQELLECYSELLQFPNYFGFNWDALYDMLCDLHWVKEEYIILVHDKLPVLTNEDWEDYMDVLYSVIESWEKPVNENVGAHHVIVIFPLQFEDFIKKVICKVS